MRLYGTMQIDDDNNLQIGGIRAQELVDNFGSPLLVLDEEEIRRNIQKYKKALENNYPYYRILYAGKAFLNRTICKILTEEDIGLDVVSGGELFISQKADFPPSRVFFHGNNKSRKEIEFALDSGIGRFMIDNFYEASIIDELAEQRGVKAKALLRLAPGIHADTHEYIRTGVEDTKFGVNIKSGQAFELVELINSYSNLELTGVHAHIGSQIFEADAFLELIEVMFSFLDKIRKEFKIELTQLDLGGGIGIPYLSSDDVISIDEFIEKITNKIRMMAQKYSYPLPELILEPGRSIIGTAGTTLYTVGSIKEIPGIRKYAAVNGGLTDNIRPALYQAKYEAIVANHCYADILEEVTIAGKCCESGDILIKDLKLPSLKSGDILAVTCTGAYTYAMASNYNGIPRPAVVLVRDGQADLIMQRETYEDLLSHDVIPEKLYNYK